MYRLLAWFLEPINEDRFCKFASRKSGKFPPILVEMAEIENPGATGLVGFLFCSCRLCMRYTIDFLHEFTKTVSNDPLLERIIGQSLNLLLMIRGNMCSPFRSLTTFARTRRDQERRAFSGASLEPLEKVAHNRIISFHP